MDNYQETFDTWNKVAKLYQDRFMDLDLYNDSYDLFCEQVCKARPSILEIGCGPGNISKYLLNKRPDSSIQGIDISPNMIELAIANNPTASFQVMDCREVHQLQSSFDGIICGFCFPYLSLLDSAKLIKDCAGLLNSKGILYISFVEGDYLQSGFQTGSSGHRVYFYFHNLEHLIKELQDNGFEITAQLNKNYMNNTGATEMHTVIIARTKQ